MTRNNSDAPRQQHYYFAHRYLVERAQQMPLYTVETLSKPTSARYLSTLWVSMGLGSKAPEDRFIPAIGIECFPVRINETCSAVVVQLPPPERVAEAYFVAIVVWHGGNQSQPENPKIRHRYITLEYSKDLSGSPHTILGEWDDGSHCNYGKGPAPNKDAFIEVVREMLTVEDEPDMLREAEAQKIVSEYALDTIPLSPVIIHSLFNIAHAFIKEGHTDFDKLILEFENYLGERFFDDVSDYLPAIVAAAEKQQNRE